MYINENKTRCKHIDYYRNCRKTCLVVEKEVEECVCNGGSRLGDTCTKHLAKGKPGVMSKKAAIQQL